VLHGDFAAAVVQHERDVDAVAAADAAPVLPRDDRARLAGLRIGCARAAGVVRGAQRAAGRLAGQVVVVGVDAAWAVNRREAEKGPATPAELKARTRQKSRCAGKPVIVACDTLTF